MPETTVECFLFIQPKTCPSFIWFRCLARDLQHVSHSALSKVLACHAAALPGDPRLNTDNTATSVPDMAECHRICKDGLARKPPMGYNSWNDLECRPSEWTLKVLWWHLADDFRPQGVLNTDIEQRLKSPKCSFDVWYLGRSHKVVEQHSVVPCLVRLIDLPTFVSLIVLSA